ncbi:unnamed protein product [Prunus armeniaca]
MNSLHVDVSSF